jgi:hypothetical protein
VHAWDKYNSCILQNESGFFPFSFLLLESWKVDVVLVNWHKQAEDGNLKEWQRLRAERIWAPHGLLNHKSVTLTQEKYEHLSCVNHYILGGGVGICAVGTFYKR